MSTELGHTTFSSSTSALRLSERFSSDRSHEKAGDGSEAPDSSAHSPPSSPEEKSPSGRQVPKFPPASLLPKVGSHLLPHRLPRIFPSVDFPNQGHGHYSEFNQIAPVWVCHPFKALYTVFFILVTAFIYLPWQALKNIPRSGRGRPAWSWTRSMTVLFLRRCISYVCQTHVILTKQPPKTEPKLKHSEFVWLDPAAYLRPAPANDSLGIHADCRGELLRAMLLQGVRPERISGYWFFAPGCERHAATPAAPDESVLYHLHGGAYWMGSAHESSPNAGMDRKLLARLAACKGAVPGRLFALEYRLANHTSPSHGSYPAALLDALVGYLYLTRACGFAPENIVLVGDSSGGNLALALCRYLRDECVAGMPGALLLVSPWSDVSRSHSGPVQAPNAFSTTVLNRGSDILDSSVLYRNTSVCAFLGRLPASEAYVNPYISPVSLHLDRSCGGCPPHWGFAGFPRRTYIITGSAELNTEQHVTLAHRLAQGTRRGVPEYVGDRISEGLAVEPLIWRDEYPRSQRVADLHCNADHGAAECVEEEALEDREVVLDEVQDGVHVFPLFSWFQPEQQQTIERMARWIAREPLPAPARAVPV
ncbi:hypothetical protein MOBT1_001222 [Malassezia obtusa]|uniref:Alpha/beta hydrolase fold-3 domain-containing protein n=1 Tax=Malassezia obtusa TaxID=76774 RepID=A0AAF0IST2_9BASI|nr:hypothetical protein MOBT1_001222 [Malassezia obtusa]